MPYEPEQWHDFATSFTGAAAALLGLAFVAISFDLDAILRFGGDQALMTKRSQVDDLGDGSAPCP